MHYLLLQDRCIHTENPRFLQEKPFLTVRKGSLSQLTVSSAILWKDSPLFRRDSIVILKISVDGIVSGRFQAKRIRRAILNFKGEFRFEG